MIENILYMLQVNDKKHSGRCAMDILVLEGRFCFIHECIIRSSGIKAQSNNSGVSTGLWGCQSGLKAGRSPNLNPWPAQTREDGSESFSIINCCCAGACEQGTSSLPAAANKPEPSRYMTLHVVVRCFFESHCRWNDWLLSKHGSVNSCQIQEYSFHYFKLHHHWTQLSFNSD